MTHAILVLTVVVLCLAVAGGVTYVNAPMFLKPRPRRGSAGLPAIDPAVLAHMRAAPVSGKLRARRPAVTASPEGTGPDHPRSGPVPAPTRTDLPIPPPRNGVRLQDRPRQTVDVIICDPAVTPVVPRWYQAWLDGRFTP